MKTSKSTITPEDFITLLEIHDAVSRLESIVTLLTGENTGIGCPGGIFHTLGKLTDLIESLCPGYDHEGIEEANEWFYKILEDQKIDNAVKARFLLSSAPGLTD